MAPSRDLPVVLVEKMESDLEEAPEHLMSLLRDQVEVIWIDEFLEEPAKFKDVKIMAIMIFHGKPKVTEELVEKLPHLKLVAVFGAGYNNVDTKMLQSRNIKVSNTPKVLDDACANQAMLLILAAAREFIRDVKRTMAPTTTALLKNHVTIGVDKKTLGIVGMGNIGLAIAKRAKAFNMTIRYHNRNKRTDDGEVDAIFHPKLNEMIPLCDYVIVTVSLTATTKGIIGKEQLDLMKTSAALINVSRGPTVDHDALTDVLRSGGIRFAALDVTDPEPLPRGHPLLEMENVVITGHTSSATYESRCGMCQKSIDNVVAMWKGEELPSEVPRY